MHPGGAGSRHAHHVTAVSTSPINSQSGAFSNSFEFALSSSATSGITDDFTCCRSCVRLAERDRT
jgi:hypothetical protein